MHTYVITAIRDSEIVLYNFSKQGKYFHSYFSQMTQYTQIFWVFLKMKAKPQMLIPRLHPLPVTALGTYPLVMLQSATLRDGHQWSQYACPYRGRSRISKVEGLMMDCHRRTVLQ
jgi:hypothetical protein